MVRVKPFQPLRPPVTLASEVSAAAFEKPEHGLYPNIPPTKGLSYKRILSPSEFTNTPLSNEEALAISRQTLQEFLQKEYLVRESDPAFYVYQQTVGKKTFRGLIGTYDIKDYEEGKIKKHELTHKAKEQAIADYFLQVGVSGSPVMLTFPASNNLEKLFADIKTNPHLFNFVSMDGIHHELWQVQNDQKVQHIQEIFGNMNALYIADGHHRCAAYANFHKKMGDQGAASGMAFMIPDNEIHIHGFHRMLKSLKGWKLDELLKAIDDYFEVTPLQEKRLPGQTRELVMVAKGNWFMLKPRKKLYHQASYKANLDVYLLDQYLIKPFMGIEEAQQEKEIFFVEGTMNVGQLEKTMDDEGMNVAFLLHPIPIDYLMNLADNGETLPPKSTWIEPKLRSGLTVQELY